MRPSYIFSLITAMLICVVFIFSAGVSCGTAVFDSSNTFTPATISMDKVQHIPRAGDTVDCEDGTSYKITDVSRYVQTPANPSAPEPLPEALLLNSLEDDAIHFSDISGDYLFVKNRYEIIRMLYALNEPAEASGICLQFSIPENAVPIVQESWDPEQVIQS